MAEGPHRNAAENYAQLAITGDYVNEEYPQRLAMIAQAHAILHVADQLEELVRVIGATCGRP